MISLTGSRPRSAAADTSTHPLIVHNQGRTDIPLPLPHPAGFVIPPAGYDAFHPRGQRRFSQEGL